MIKKVKIDLDSLEHVITTVVGYDERNSILFIENAETAGVYHAPVGTVLFLTNDEPLELITGEIREDGYIIFNQDAFSEWVDNLYIYFKEYFGEEFNDNFDLGIVFEKSKDGWFDYPVGTIYQTGYRDSQPICECEFFTEKE